MSSNRSMSPDLRPVSVKDMSESRASLNPDGSSSTSQPKGTFMLRYLRREVCGASNSRSILTHDKERDVMPCGVKAGRGHGLSRGYDESKGGFWRYGRDLQISSRVMDASDEPEGGGGPPASK